MQFTCIFEYDHDNNTLSCVFPCAFSETQRERERHDQNDRAIAAFAPELRHSTACDAIARVEQPPTGCAPPPGDTLTPFGERNVTPAHKLPSFSLQLAKSKR